MVVPERMFRSDCVLDIFFCLIFISRLKQKLRHLLVESFKEKTVPCNRVSLSFCSYLYSAFDSGDGEWLCAIWCHWFVLFLLPAQYSVPRFNVNVCGMFHCGFHLMICAFVSFADNIIGTDDTKSSYGNFCAHLPLKDQFSRRSPQHRLILKT